MNIATSETLLPETLAPRFKGMSIRVTAYNPSENNPTDKGAKIFTNYVHQPDTGVYRKGRAKTLRKDELQIDLHDEKNRLAGRAIVLRHPNIAKITEDFIRKQDINDWGWPDSYSKYLEQPALLVEALKEVFDSIRSEALNPIEAEIAENFKTHHAQDLLDLINERGVDKFETTGSFGTDVAHGTDLCKERREGSTADKPARRKVQKQGAWWLFSFMDPEPDSIREGRERRLAKEQQTPKNVL